MTLHSHFQIKHQVIGEAVIAALEAERELRVVEAELMQDCSLEIVNEDRILAHVVREVEATKLETTSERPQVITQRDWNYSSV